ncbi:MAG: hypothetical protein EBZ59_11950, partial [Planctomycetia bacterium]|nr:hypothetical protein [Planctomycetia bacterium]
LDLDARMRTVAWRLRSDLAGVTARTLPPLSPDSGEGYFELIEGPNTDASAAPDGTTVGPADCDDVLLFTTRSNDLPFVGQSPSVSGSPNLFESSVAEVGWFARATPGTSNPQTFTLYRKQLLVMGYVGAYPFFTGSNTLQLSGSWSGYFNLPCDVSVRREVDTLTPNTLSDLTRRENRFMHNTTGTTGLTNYPFPFVSHQLASTTPATAETISTTVIDGLIFDSTSPRQGEDVVLTNVIAFDVRVFDPAAPVVASASGGTPLVAGDPGFTNAPIASGAYVDLGNGVSSNALLTGVAPRFAGYGQGILAGSATARRTYDTWSTHYEANGRDEDGDGVVDDGTNGRVRDRPPLPLAAPRHRDPHPLLRAVEQAGPPGHRQAFFRPTLRPVSPGRCSLGRRPGSHAAIPPNPSTGGPSTPYDS